MRRAHFAAIAAFTLLGCDIFWVGGEETWTDSATGLEWQNPSSEMRNGWEQADGTCRTLTWAGKTGWRMPSFDELKTIHDPVGHKIYDQFCHWKRGLYGTCGNFWTSNTSYDGEQSAEFINFDEATDPETNRAFSSTTIFDNLYVRCVRGGSPPADASTEDGTPFPDVTETD